MFEAQRAYQQAEKHGADKHSRESASKVALWAYFYAMYIDKGPHEVTRRGVAGDPELVNRYYLDVEKAPRRSIKSFDPIWRFSEKL